MTGDMVGELLTLLPEAIVAATAVVGLLLGSFLPRGHQAPVRWLGVAGAVAGLGTYSTFTDSTTPVATAVTSGVLSISLMDGASVATAPFQGGTFMAGDSVSKALDLVNDGDTGLASVTMRSWATDSSVLDTDKVNGLQLLVRDCSVPWAGSGAAASCAGTASESSARTVR
jgi:hypothetical protein